jgi:hypothetical protein
MIRANHSFTVRLVLTVMLSASIFAGASVYTPSTHAGGTVPNNYKNGDGEEDKITAPSDSLETLLGRFLMLLGELF